MELSPNRFAPNYSLGSAYASRKQWEPALSSFKNAVKAAEENSEEESSALQKLYVVTMNKLEEDSPSGPTSREDMMNQFLKLMGEENYRKLAARRQ